MKQQIKATSDKRLMRIGTFCDRYDTSRTRAYAEAKAGRLRLTKIGKSTRVTEDDAEAWLRSLQPAA
jgi:hypothetical protein